MILDPCPSTLRMIRTTPAQDTRPAISKTVKAGASRATLASSPGEALAGEEIAGSPKNANRKKTRAGTNAELASFLAGAMPDMEKIVRSLTGMESATLTKRPSIQRVWFPVSVPNDE